MKKYIVPAVVGGIVLVAVGFFGGTALSRRSMPGGPGGDSFSFRGAAPMEGGNASRVGGVARGGGGMSGGEILSVGDGSLTVKLPDGGSKIIYVSDATDITKSVAGSVSELSVGNRVTVMGNANDDGSVTAASIRVDSDTSENESK